MYFVRGLLHLLIADITQFPRDSLTRLRGFALIQPQDLRRGRWLMSRDHIRLTVQFSPEVLSSSTHFHTDMAFMNYVFLCHFFFSLQLKLVKLMNGEKYQMHL